LAESAQPLEKKQPEGKLGDFVADACMQEAAALTRETIDLALFNHGGLRRSLPMGAITLGDVYELMPFDNELVVITLRGSKLLELLNHVASTGGAPVSGIRMLIGGEPLDTNRTYRVLTSDYLANGGDRYTAFADALGKEELRLRVRDAIVQRLEKLGQQRQTLVVTLDGRIQHAE
jgi:2',3'-cyclic-nucleotide 2'-phosphodiesterase (5'-nucleotidase family)